MEHLNASDILKLATHVADTGGFCLAMAVEPDGETVRLAVLPAHRHLYAVQVEHTWQEGPRKCHKWVEIDCFAVLADAADFFCHVVENGICEMSPV